MSSLLSRDRIVAPPSFNRWLVPPAALAIHLSIGMAYGFSVFWLPLSRAVGITAPTAADWRVSTLGWMYTLFFVLLGSSAALFGRWVEEEGPRKAGVIAACCWGGGFFISALGVHLHQIALLWIGSGIIGGCGLGLGYISPVSTLVKWFPDRRGMATGMAIMGFGGGAMIGSPFADLLMNRFRTPASVGVLETFLTLAVVYFVFMLAGAFGYRVPPTGWRPEGWTPPASAQSASLITTAAVHVRDAHRTPAFWWLWLVLCLNVSAGIGVLGMASPMLQEIFGGALIGRADVGFTALDESQLKLVASVAAGFTALLSLFNILGRFFWASLSDVIGRKLTYFTFFALGIVLYAASPFAAHAGSKTLFVALFCVILTMYGGGFATIPAYLADLFGAQFVGAIHGRLLTAWSTAGIVGPILVNYIREAQIAAGVPREQVYDRTLYILAAILALGFVANWAVRPVAARWHMKPETLASLQVRSGEPVAAGSFGIGLGGFDASTALAWLAVGAPIAWGVYVTLAKAVALFR